MKKSMLYAGLLSLIGIIGYAESATQPHSIVTTPGGTIQPTATGGATGAVDSNNQPIDESQSQTTDTSAGANQTQTTPTGTQPNQLNGSNSFSTPTQNETTPNDQNPSSFPSAQNQLVLDCNYKIPADKTAIDQTIIEKWSVKAAQQAFNFDFKLLDKQLNNLKPCFTEQGWQSFNDALKKSGNLDAIKADKLIVSSVLDGGSTITAAKDNQWKISLPLQVFYQNEKEKIKQQLTINLVVGRKVSGNLGIMQIIATPRQNEASVPSPASTSVEQTKPVDQSQSTQ